MRFRDCTLGNCRWEANDGNPGLDTLYPDVMDAIVAIDDRVIFFVEGAGQTGFGCSWGKSGACWSSILATEPLEAALMHAKRLPQATALSPTAP